MDASKQIMCKLFEIHVFSQRKINQESWSKKYNFNIHKSDAVLHRKAEVKHLDVVQDEFLN